MKLSFAIPAYNEEKNIGPCLESILKEAADSTYDIEIVVANNASSDKTKEIALSFPRVKVVDEARKGIIWARQAAYQGTTGDLIANVDADNRLTPGWIAKVFQEFENDPGLVALSGPVYFYDIIAWQKIFIKLYYIGGYLLYHLTRLLFRRGAMLQGGNYIIKKESLERIGGYDTSIEFYGEDTDIARRANEVGRTKFTFGLPILSSGRRLAAEGIIKMALRYGLNYFWVIVFKRPFTKGYIDVRK